MTKFDKLLIAIISLCIAGLFYIVLQEAKHGQATVPQVQEQ